MKASRLALLAALLAGCQVTVNNPSVTANTQVNADTNALVNATGVTQPSAVVPSQVPTFSPIPSIGPTGILTDGEFIAHIPANWEVKTQGFEAQQDFTTKGEASFKIDGKLAAILSVGTANFNADLDTEWKKYELADSSMRNFKLISSTKTSLAFFPGFSVKRSYAAASDGNTVYEHVFGALHNGKLYVVIADYSTRYPQGEAELDAAYTSWEWRPSNPTPAVTAAPLEPLPIPALPSSAPVSPSPVPVPSPSPSPVVSEYERRIASTDPDVYSSGSIAKVTFSSTADDGSHIQGPGADQPEYHDNIKVFIVLMDFETSEIIGSYRGTTGHLDTYFYVSVPSSQSLKRQLFVSYDIQFPAGKQLKGNKVLTPAPSF